MGAAVVCRVFSAVASTRVRARIPFLSWPAYIGLCRRTRQSASSFFGGTDRTDTCVFIAAFFATRLAQGRAQGPSDRRGSCCTAGLWPTARDRVRRAAWPRCSFSACRVGLLGSRAPCPACAIPVPCPRRVGKMRETWGFEVAPFIGSIKQRGAPRRLFLTCSACSRA